MMYEQNFLSSLSLTLIVEVPIVLLFIRSIFRKKEIGILKIIFVGILASALTLPYLWFILPVYIFNRNVYIFFGEALIIIIEAIIYNQILELKFREALIISLVANLMSIIIGLL